MYEFVFAFVDALRTRILLYPRPKRLPLHNICQHSDKRVVPCSPGYLRVAEVPVPFFTSATVPERAHGWVPSVISNERRKRRLAARAMRGRVPIAKQVRRNFYDSRDTEKR